MCVFATHTKNTSNTGHQQTAPPQSPLAHNNDQVEQRREGTHSPTVSQESDPMSGAKEAKAVLVLWGHKNIFLRRLLPVWEMVKNTHDDEKDGDDVLTMMMATTTTASSAHWPQASTPSSMMLLMMMCQQSSHPPTLAPKGAASW